MKKIICTLSIGFPAAVHEDDMLQVTGLTLKEWEELSEEEKSVYVNDWASNYIEAGYHEEE